MKPVSERIKEAETKLKQLRAYQQKMDAQQRAAIAKKTRADDTRRKVLVGAMLLEKMGRDADTKKNIISQLDNWLSREDDRQLFDLPVDRNIGAGHV
jgi:large subunit ribosomal protein L7/L12